MSCSYIGFTLKVESVAKNTTFGLKMMVKSGLPPCGKMFSFVTEFVILGKNLPFYILMYCMYTVV